MRLPACALLLLMLLAVDAVQPVQAQIRRCVTADGGHVYTDRSCPEIGATERAPRASTTTRGGRIIRRDCSRNLQDLVHELGAAIDSRDVNRLAGIYHWPGTSTRNAYALMGRLDTIVNRPLIDITPLQPPPPPPTVMPRATDPLAWQTAPQAAAAQDPGSTLAARDSRTSAALPEQVEAAAMQQQRARRTPTGLVVDQTVANRITPLQTVFSLRRHLGCWWVSL